MRKYSNEKEDDELNEHNILSDFKRLDDKRKDDFIDYLCHLKNPKVNASVPAQLFEAPDLTARKA